MSATNPKNAALSAAATDLGLGAQLMAQATMMENERKKKLTQLAPGAPLLGGAAQALFGGSAAGG